MRGQRGKRFLCYVLCVLTLTIIYSIKLVFFWLFDAMASFPTHRTHRPCHALSVLRLNICEEPRDHSKHHKISIIPVKTNDLPSPTVHDHQPSSYSFGDRWSFWHSLVSCSLKAIYYGNVSGVAGGFLFEFQKRSCVRDYVRSGGLTWRANERADATMRAA